MEIHHMQRIVKLCIMNDYTIAKYSNLLLLRNSILDAIVAPKVILLKKSLF